MADSNPVKRLVNMVLLEAIRNRVAIASRIKVMSNLDIAERRLPQDGRIELVVNGNPVDLRVSVRTLFSWAKCATWRPPRYPSSRR